MFAIGGFAANLPADATNPLLAGPSPIYSRLSVLQFVPAAAVRVTDRLSLGFAPTITMAEAQLDPFIFQPLPYPSGTHSRPHWGLGFEVGMYYETCCDWRFGASYKSPQWFEDFTFYPGNALGQFELAANYPGIFSVGTAYYGLPGVVWAIDFRYVDYNNADLFGDPAGFDPTGAVTGLGWRSVGSVATGLQFALTEALSLRLGYLYTQNPISDANTFFNVASPAIYQNIVAIGGSWNISCRTSLSLAYLHAFENSIAGPSYAPGVDSVALRQTIDVVIGGMQVKF